LTFFYPQMSWKTIIFHYDKMKMKESFMKPKLVLIDGNSILFRAYYATAYPGATLMQTSKGEYTNALFAFINMFEQIVTKEIKHVLVAFDTKAPTKRHEAFEAYKAGRVKMPEELVEQLPLIDEYIRLMGIHTYRQEGYEADDIIGTLSKLSDYDVHIYSSDRDLLQLVSEHVTVHLLKKGMKEVLDVTPKVLDELYGLTTAQFIDFKALMGDPSDNIPGIPGVGEKTAIKLLKEYGSLDQILAHQEDIKGKLGASIRNNVELAKMSLMLVTIDTSAQLDMPFDFIQRKSFNSEALQQFLQRYELHMLAKKIEVTKNVEAWDVIEITSDDAFLNIIEEKLAMHVEFSDSNYHTAFIWGIGFSNGNTHYAIDGDYIDKLPSLKAYLENDQYEKWVYDAKAICVAMKWRDIDVKGMTFDLLLSSYILNAHIGKEEFKRVVSSYQYEDMEYDETIYGKGAKKALPIAPIYLKHIASKAKAIAALRDDQLVALEKANQLTLLEDVELPLSFVLANMEFEGVLVDQAQLDLLEQEFSASLKLLETQIHSLAGQSFNIQSPKQLGDILFEVLKLPMGKKTKTGYSTNAEVLEKLKRHHPIIELVLNYRQLSKLLSTYIEGLRPHIMADGKIHTIYMQALTTTGRLSSVEPNLQNIPIRTEEGRRIRSLFIAEEGHQLLGADYSQIELRVLAHVADVKGLKEAFNDEVDIHTETAKKVFKTNDVTSNERRAAKAVNFGIIYGIGAWSLAEDIDVTPKEAQLFIDTYLEVYPEIKAYMSNIIEDAKQKTYVETILKRRRYIPELASSVFMQRSFGERLALNAPIQGSAADILKLAMIQLDQALKEGNFKSKMILQVHDELILHVDQNELEDVSLLVENKMKHAYPLDVALEVSMDHGTSWYEVK
jgi:DNA polymerase I